MLWWVFMFLVTRVVRAQNNTGPIESLEVDVPLLPSAAPVASQILLDNYVFATSYGKPAVVDYQPPSGVEFSYATLTVNWSVYGRQFDRLCHIRFNGVEVWRPSTAEPLFRNVSATSTKDVSGFIALLQQPSTLEFELANVVDSTYTGPYTTSLRIDYYNDPVSTDWWYGPIPPNNIQPVVSGTSDFPPAAIGYTQVPKNTTRAVLNVFASGNSDEEFWYTNTLTSQGGPVRLVEAWVGDSIAGIADPWPIMFTGAISPGQWQPIVGTKAFDVPSYQFDVTPYLPQLWQGVEITIKISNGYNGDSPLSDWLINAALLTWEEAGVVGSGTQLPTQYQNLGSLGTNMTNSSWAAAYHHSLTTCANLTFSSNSTGSRSGLAQWKQDVYMRNVQVSSNTAWYMMQVGGGHSSYSWDDETYWRHHEYPFFASENITSSGNAFFLEADRVWQETTGNSNGTTTIRQTASTIPQGNITLYQNAVDVTAPGNIWRSALAQNRTLIKDECPAAGISYGNPYAQPVRSTSQTQFESAMNQLKTAYLDPDNWIEYLTVLAEDAYDASFEEFKPRTFVALSE